MFGLESASLLSLLIAIVTGGALTKLIERLFTAPKNRLALRHAQEDRLIAEIDRLRTEVAGLRSSVDGLRLDLMQKVGEVSGLSTRWYALRTASLALTSYVKHSDIPTSVDLSSILSEIADLVHEHALWGDRNEEERGGKRAPKAVANAKETNGG